MDTVAIVAISAFAGGVVSGILGYLKTGDDFDGRKFLPTFLRAMLAGGGIALSYPLIEGIGFWPAVIGGFLAGAGLDVGLHRVAGTIKR